jgi:hypothetical protein
LKVERFLVEMSDIPNLKNRIDSMITMLVFDTNAELLSAKCQRGIKALGELGRWDRQPHGVRVMMSDF